MGSGKVNCGKGKKRQRKKKKERKLNRQMDHKCGWKRFLLKASCRSEWTSHDPKTRHNCESSRIMSLFWWPSDCHLVHLYFNGIGGTIHGEVHDQEESLRGFVKTQFRSFFFHLSSHSMNDFVLWIRYCHFMWVILHWTSTSNICDTKFDTSTVTLCYLQGTETTCRHSSQWGRILMTTEGGGGLDA